MLITKRKPATVGEILVQEFMEPMKLTQGVLAEAMDVQRKHVNELCNDRGRGVIYAHPMRPGATSRKYFCAGIAREATVLRHDSSYRAISAHQLVSRNW